MNPKAPIFLFVFAALGALAHPGGLDANGGHTDRATGIYHFHRGTNAPPGSPPLKTPSAATVSANSNRMATPVEPATNAVVVPATGVHPSPDPWYTSLPWWVYLVGLGSGYLLWEVAFHYYQKRKGGP